MKKQASNKKIKTWYYSVNIKAIKVKFSQCSLSYEGWFFFCRQKQITKKWVSHFNILNGFNDTLQTEVKIFYVEIISVLNLFQEYMASRPVVPQNHNDMADSLLFIPWYIYLYIYIYNANLMHVLNHKHLTHKYKHHQQEQDHLSISYANPHTKSNHTKNASHLLSKKYFILTFNNYTFSLPLVYYSICQFL